MPRRVTGTVNRRNPLQELHTFDPETANTVATALNQMDLAVPPEAMALLVDETIWGLCTEVTFGHAIAKGFLDLIAAGRLERIDRYRDLVRKAGETGPTIGRIMATYLVPVLTSGDDGLLDRFLSAVRIMAAKGTYTLNRPLEALKWLLDSGQQQTAALYIDLLRNTFSLPLSYNQSLHFTHILPKTVRSFSSSKRDFQIEQLSRILQVDYQLVDALIEGVEKGLYLLSEGALKKFVSTGLRKHAQDEKAAAKFLSLNSRIAHELLSELQIAVSLSELTPQLNRYLQARTGLNISVRPLSALSGSIQNGDLKDVRVCSGGRFLYLPDEIELFGRQSENEKLYKCLTRFESGLYEFGTFDFDLEKVMDGWSVQPTGSRQDDTEPDAVCLNQGDGDRADLDLFFNRFTCPQLARDLFTVFEHGRVKHLLDRFYPGLVRTYLPMIQAETRRMIDSQSAVDPLLLLYARIAVDIKGQIDARSGSDLTPWLNDAGTSFERMLEKENSSPEDTAILVDRFYNYTEKIAMRGNNGVYKALRVPFQRSLRVDLHYSAQLSTERLARKIKNRLAIKGLRAYKSDIKKLLITRRDSVDPDTLKDVLLELEKKATRCQPNERMVSADLTDVDLADLNNLFAGEQICIDPGPHPVTMYKEWDCRLGDYLNDHVRVLDRTPNCEASRYYQATLKRYRDLVKNIRYSFELLKPEGLKLYRRWIEGDAFDYRALLDFVLEKKAGHTPSERLYIKRLKEMRDVAVLLLVDLSRSTANVAAENSATVIDVEKEAIVLFSEALEVVGDTYAIAGFSGTGRLGVDYFHIKDFKEQMSDQVRQRIAAMAPQRNTRMGAAIRHAASQFLGIPSRVRLVIILGDGFPNDLAYKGNYAIEDTRAAISELRASNIYVHAITINMNISESNRLDDLYGDIHHNMIAEVSELPNKLWRIYGSLTR
jgi:fructose-specific component phosphotransferase system IIB-like protein